LLDDELMKMIKKELPRKIPHIFISSHTGYNLPQLKDKLWGILNP
jgi:GTP-binding protein